MLMLGQGRVAACYYLDSFVDVKKTFRRDRNV